MRGKKWRIRGESLAKETTKNCRYILATHPLSSRAKSNKSIVREQKVVYASRCQKDEYTKEEPFSPRLLFSQKTIVRLFCPIPWKSEWDSKTTRKMRPRRKGSNFGKKLKESEKRRNKIKALNPRAHIFSALSQARTYSRLRELKRLKYIKSAERARAPPKGENMRCGKCESFLPGFSYSLFSRAEKPLIIGKLLFMYCEKFWRYFLLLENPEKALFEFEEKKKKFFPRERFHQNLSVFFFWKMKNFSRVDLEIWWKRLCSRNF